MSCIAAAAAEQRVFSSLARPPPARPAQRALSRPALMQQMPMKRPRQPQPPCRTRLLVAAGEGSDGGGRSSPAKQPAPAQLLMQLGLPMLVGLLAGAVVIRPLLLGLVFVERISITLVGLAGVLACAGLALALLWLAVPPLASIFGVSTVVTAGGAAVMLAAAAAGVFKVPALVPPLLLGGSLLALGFQVQSIFAVGGGGGSDSSGSRDDPPADPDVEGRHQEVSREQQEWEAELHAFDELLGSRDGVRQRGGPPFR